MDFLDKLAHVLDAVDSMNCGFISRDKAGVILHVNSRLLTWLGYSRDELEGHSVEMMFPKDMHDVIREELKAVDGGDLRARLSMARRKDGTAFPIISIPQLLKERSGEVIGGYSIVVDLGAVYAAKSVTSAGEGSLRGSLSKIAAEIQMVALTARSDAKVPRLDALPELDELSTREREVVGLLADGSRVPGIAKSLHISPHTVRNHLKSVFRKLDVSSQSELIERLRSSADPAVDESA